MSRRNRGLSRNEIGMQLEESDDEDRIGELNTGETGWDDDSDWDEEEEDSRVIINSQYQYRGDDLPEMCLSENSGDDEDGDSLT